MTKNHFQELKRKKNNINTYSTNKTKRNKSYFFNKSI